MGASVSLPMPMAITLLKTFISVICIHTGMNNVQTTSSLQKPDQVEERLSLLQPPDASKKARRSGQYENLLLLIS